MLKQTNETIEEVNTEEVTEEEATAAPYDPWKDMRAVYVPKRSRTEQNTLEVGVNDKTYFVPKDQPVEVPAPVWEVITEMMRRQKIMEDEAKRESDRQKAAMAQFI